MLSDVSSLLVWRLRSGLTVLVLGDNKSERQPPHGLAQLAQSNAWLAGNVCCWTVFFLISPTLQRMRILPAVERLFPGYNSVFRFSQSRTPNKNGLCWDTEWNWGPWKRTRIGSPFSEQSTSHKFFLALVIATYRNFNCGGCISWMFLKLQRLRAVVSSPRYKLPHVVFDRTRVQEYLVYWGYFSKDSRRRAIARVQL